MKKKKFYMVTLVIWIILLICMLFMDFHILPDTEPNPNVCRDHHWNDKFYGPNIA